MSNFVNAG